MKEKVALVRCDSYDREKVKEAITKAIDALGGRENALEEYTRRFGPITPEQVNNGERWTWVDDPWPWERR